MKTGTDRAADGRTRDRTTRRTASETRGKSRYSRIRHLLIRPMKEGGSQESGRKVHGDGVPGLLC